jgi:hypothetical protein
MFTPSLTSYSNTLLALFNNRIPLKDHASMHISTPRAGTPAQIEENSSQTWTFADHFVRRPSDVKSAPPYIMSFDQRGNLEELSPPSNVSHARPFSVQCIHSPQYPQALAPSLRQRVEVPLSSSLRVKKRLSRISSFGLPIRPLPPTP